MNDGKSTRALELEEKDKQLNAGEAPMAIENPYQSSALFPERVDGRCPSSNRSLWLAYLFAPAVAPLSFVSLLFLVGVVSTQLGIDINEASFVVLPLLALTVGMVSCYLVAGVIGMPIAFYLRRTNSLNGYSIHAVAFGWAVFFTFVCGLFFTDGNWRELPLALSYIGLGVIPPVLLSGTTFWLLVRRFSRKKADGLC